MHRPKKKKVECFVYKLEESLINVDANNKTQHNNYETILTSTNLNNNNNCIGNEYKQNNRVY